MDISLEKLEAAITPFQCGKKGFVAVKPFDLSKRRNDVQDHVSKRIPPRTGCFACIHFLSANDIVHFETIGKFPRLTGQIKGQLALVVFHTKLRNRIITHEHHDVKCIDYRKGADGEPEIVPEEASIVERIFNMYLSGETINRISTKLREENLQIPGKRFSFSASMIKGILRNERYCGDSILQKTVTIDCIGKVRRKNTGEAPMYYVQNSHVGIISRELFHKTQEELARRMSREPNSTKTATTATGKYSRYALSNVMTCAECGSRYKRVTWTSRGKKRVVWRCISRLDYGKRYCKTSLTVDETALHAAIVRAINRFNEEDESTYMALMRATIGEAIGLTGGTDEIDLLRRKIDGLNRKMVSLINESVESGEGIESHEAEFKELSDTIELLQGRIQKLEEALASDQVNDSRILQLQQIIADRASKKMEYDDTIVHQMIECVKVYPDGRLDIIFGGGYLIEERLEKEN